jgi:hypothetical protein
LLHDINTISTANAATVEAKFEYGSTISLGGKNYKAGFGLVQTGTISGDGTTYNSEFWIDASKFKFTNSNNTGQVSPFTIDASGSTPQITFNGNVVINNRATAIPGGLPKFLGNYIASPTAAVSGDSYKNTSTGVVYVWDGSSWITTKGDNGINGSRGTGFGVSTADSPSDNAFTSSTGFPYAIDGDQLLLTNSSGSRFYRRQYGIWGNDTALQVDGNAIINGMALVKGKLLTGNGIESNNYVPESSGWRINAEGDAEFNSLVVRSSNVSGAFGKVFSNSLTSIGSGTFNNESIFYGCSITVTPPIPNRSYAILVTSGVTYVSGSISLIDTVGVVEIGAVNYTTSYTVGHYINSEEIGTSYGSNYLTGSNTYTVVVKLPFSDSNIIVLNNFKYITSITAVVVPV